MFNIHTTTDWEALQAQYDGYRKVREQLSDEDYREWQAEDERLARIAEASTPDPTPENTKWSKSLFKAPERESFFYTFI